MLSNVTTQDMQKSSDSGLVVSVMISTYPLANNGYLVSFFEDDPDGNFKAYDPANSLDFEASKLSNFLEFNSVLLPKGCYYLPPKALGDFICSLSHGSFFFEMQLLSPNTPLQGLLLVKVDEKSLLMYEQEEEDKR